MPPSPSEPRLTLVAAMARNRVIGMGGKMPWHLPDELRHFKRVTTGKPVIMGRKTHESIGMVLPGRQNLVVTRNARFTANGCEVVGSIAEALERARGEEVMVIGGGEIYRLALPLATRMLLTIVDCEPEGDTWFPEWEIDDWEMNAAHHHPADQRHAYSFDYQDWERIMLPASAALLDSNPDSPD